MIHLNRSWGRSGADGYRDGVDVDAPPRRRRSTRRGTLGPVRGLVASVWAGIVAVAGPLASAAASRWRRLTRGQARVLLAGAAVVAMAAGYGSAALAVGTGAPEELVVGGSRLGPVRIDLPDELGPWEAAPAAGLDAVRSSQALGGTPVDGAWGRVAPDALVVTVLTADAGRHGGLTGVTGPFDRDSQIEWDGRRPHLAGAATAGGIRELVLVTQTDEGDLVLLSVSGPVEAFASGSLEEAFRAARVVE